jgi:hypothetical protein
MFKKKKKSQGIELIDEVMGRFSTMVTELTTGVHDCEDEKADIESQIESLHQRDVVLASSIKRAEIITKNLRSLIGE